jgi:hypothetical protein
MEVKKNKIKYENKWLQIKNHNLNKQLFRTHPKLAYIYGGNKWQ